MSLFKFVKWWWCKSDGTERTVAILLFHVFAFGPVCYFYGFLIAVIATLACVFLCFILFLFYVLCEYMREQWEVYNKAIEKERDRIVSRLAGRR